MNNYLLLWGVYRKMTNYLFQAIYENNAERLKDALFENPECVDLKHEKGFTPLILATYMNQPDGVDLLLEHGADPNQTDAMGNTALMGVAFKSHLALAERLIQAGADVNAANHQDQTALIFAAMHGHSEMVQFLLKHGALKHMKDSHGKTALDYAKSQNSIELIAALNN